MSNAPLIVTFTKGSTVVGDVTLIHKTTQIAYDEKGNAVELCLLLIDSKGVRRGTVSVISKHSQTARMYSVSGILGKLSQEDRDWIARTIAAQRMGNS